MQVAEVLLALVEAVVRDGGAEHEHEPDDAARHGVRRLGEGQRALRVAHDVGAAPVDLERLRAQARDDREQDLREHARQNRASHAEQRRDERPGAARVLERGNGREAREDAVARTFELVRNLRRGGSDLRVVTRRVAGASRFFFFDERVHDSFSFQRFPQRRQRNLVAEKNVVV